MKKALKRILIPLIGFSIFLHGIPPTFCSTLKEDLKFLKWTAATVGSGIMLSESLEKISIAQKHDAAIENLRAKMQLHASLTREEQFAAANALVYVGYSQVPHFLEHLHNYSEACKLDKQADKVGAREISGWGNISINRNKQSINFHIQNALGYSDNTPPQKKLVNLSLHAKYKSVLWAGATIYSGINLLRSLS